MFLISAFCFESLLLWDMIGKSTMWTCNKAKLLSVNVLIEILNLITMNVRYFMHKIYCIMLLPLCQCRILLKAFVEFQFTCCPLGCFMVENLTTK